ncbi:MAG: cyclase family protein [Pikeienuella sp.]|uniref:cyclase family protein n=1 Tax=Pikeienuella sp. TaxID=2831957 RepID=UPI00391AC787
MTISRLAAAACAALFASALGAAAQDCQPSKWGADDEIGAANLVTPERVAAAAKLVVKGEAHPLGIVIDPNMPAFPPRKMQLQVVQPGQQGGKTLEGGFGWPGSYNDDISQLWWGTGPQLDGLGHLGENDTYYNCNKGADFAQLTGLTKLGIDKVPPIVARGVLVDMAKHLGVETMEAGQAITSDMIKEAAAAQGVEFREGDVILFHTGWTDAKLNAEPAAWVSGEPGLTNEAAVFLAGFNPVAVGADTWGLEAVPPAPGDKVFYGHVTLLAHNGIYILETMNTGRLAAEEVHEFMFVLGQARLKGAVQMMINPVAMW